MLSPVTARVHNQFETTFPKDGSTRPCNGVSRSRKEQGADYHCSQLDYNSVTTLCVSNLQ